MRFITAPDNHSCAAASISMVTSIPLDIVLKGLYNSLEYPFPPPYEHRPKVPTTDEIGEWLYTNYRFGIMPFNRNPVCSPAPGVAAVPVWENGDEAWLRHLSLGKGLLEGHTSKGGHMCAWDGGMVFDPRGYKYVWPQRKGHGFDAFRFWLVIYG